MLTPRPPVAMRDQRDRGHEPAVAASARFPSSRDTERPSPTSAVTNIGRASPRRGCSGAGTRLQTWRPGGCASGFETIIEVSVGARLNEDRRAERDERHDRQDHRQTDPCRPPAAPHRTGRRSGRRARSRRCRRRPSAQPHELDQTITASTMLRPPAGVARRAVWRTFRSPAQPGAGAASRRRSSDGGSTGTRRSPRRQRRTPHPPDRTGVLQAGDRRAIVSRRTPRPRRERTTPASPASSRRGPAPSRRRTASPPARDPADRRGEGVAGGPQRGAVADVARVAPLAALVDAARSGCPTFGSALPIDLRRRCASVSRQNRSFIRLPPSM